LFKLRWAFNDITLVLITLAAISFTPTRPPQARYTRAGLGVVCL
jgi:hypothetical protein